MRITWYSPAFHPMIGGLEAVVEILSRQFAVEGHRVTVITNALNKQADHFPFLVLRQPSLLEQIRVIRASDVFLHANVSLWGMFPWFLCGPKRPAWVATHHGWYAHHGRPQCLLDRLKVSLARNWAVNISVSHAVADHLQLIGHVIPNPFDGSLFNLRPNVKRNRDLVFLGRLVSDKGVDILLNALALLKQQGLTPSLTIIGSGPDRQNLESQVLRMALGDQVCFVGTQSGDALVSLLNQHRILVVPSRWSEPFGLVALEGIACGCCVIGSSAGGLPEAIGPCGTTFPNGDSKALASSLARALLQPPTSWTDPAVVVPHLTAHHPFNVASQYLSAIHNALTLSS
jgi:glycogen(starch) synthase